MFLELALTSLGISLIDFITLVKKDKTNLKNIINELDIYGFKVLNNNDLRKELWEEIFKINEYKKYRFDEYIIEYDDIKLYYLLSLMPLTNIMTLYNLMIKNKELDAPFDLRKKYCTNNKIINYLTYKNIIVEDEWLDKDYEKILEYRKKDNNEKDFNK